MRGLLVHSAARARSGVHAQVASKWLMSGGCTMQRSVVIVPGLYLVWSGSVLIRSSRSANLDLQTSDTITPVPLVFMQEGSKDNLT